MHPAVGFQNLEVHKGNNSGNVTYAANASISGTQNYQLDVLIRPSSYTAPDLNFSGHGWTYAWSQGFSDFHAVLFDVRDADDFSGTQDAEPDEFRVLFWEGAGNQRYVGNFVPGAWYQYSMIIGPMNNLLTQRVTPFGGGATLESSYATSITSIPQVEFHGDQGFGAAGTFTQFDEFSMNEVSLATPDFDGDGVADGGDVDALVAVIAAGPNDLDYDLTLNGTVDSEVLDEWLSLAGALNLPSGNSYLVGDANLDGNVNGGDFLDWNQYKFSATAAWTRGDFDASGFVDGVDFLLWKANKFTSADNVSTVPEPTTLFSGLALTLGMLGFRRLGRRGASR